MPQEQSTKISDADFTGSEFRLWRAGGSFRATLANLAAIQALGVGSAGQYLVTNSAGSAIEWETPVAGQIFGLTISNNVGDATNDIDVAIGNARDGTNLDNLLLASAITKRLDAAWAVGTNQGGRMSAAAIADTTYHVFLIKRVDTGVVDIGFDVSASAPTMPADYTLFRRIGSIIRESAAIVVFFQNGDTFRRAPATDRNSTAAAASALLALSVPTGIVVSPILQVLILIGASVNVTVSLGSAAAGSANVAVCSPVAIAADGNDRNVAIIAGVFFTNTSAQIYFAQVNTTGTPATSTLITEGWIDTRERLA